MNIRLQNLFPVRLPVIAMVHLRPLPGSPLYDPVSMPMGEIIRTALEEAKQLEDAGVDGVQVENMWDIPYVPGNKIGPETVAALAACAYAVRSRVRIPVGVECHMNGGVKALACAVAAGAKWIRVFEYCNAFISQSGFIDAIGGDMARLRRNLQAGDIAFLCDVNVKHGSHFIIHDRSVEEQALDIEAQDGDAVIVTGFDTGTPPTYDRVEKCKKATKLPIFLGSGVSPQNIAEMFPVADGVIIGSYFKKDGNWKNPVDSARAKEFMAAVNSLRGENP
jgi:membrane complex biogenesis BtpA family protein